MEKKQRKIPVVLQLFISFFKIGLFTFGGGYAMIPLIQKEAVEKKKWISDDDILEIIAIAESTPGPIAINSATFVGYRIGGVLGSFFATLGVVLPSFLIILFIAFVLREFQSIKGVQYAFWGIRAGVLALILKAVFTMYKKSKKNLLAYIIMAVAFLVVAIFDVNVIFVIIACALTGLISSLMAEKKMKEKNSSCEAELTQESCENSADNLEDNSIENFVDNTVETPGENATVNLGDDFAENSEKEEEK